MDGIGCMCIVLMAVLALGGLYYLSNRGSAAREVSERPGLSRGSRPAPAKRPPRPQVDAHEEVEAHVRQVRLEQEKDPDPMISKNAFATRLSYEAADFVKQGMRQAAIDKLKDFHHALNELSMIAPEDYTDGMERAPALDALIAEKKFADLACAELLAWYDTRRVQDDLAREDLGAYLDSHLRRGGNLRALAQNSIDFLLVNRDYDIALRRRVRENLDRVMAVTPQHFLNNEQITGYAELRRIEES